MPVVKAKFRFACEASSSDAKSNVRNVKCITLDGDSISYSFPDDLQNITTHPELVKNTTVARVVKQLERRGMVRNLMVALDETTAALYIDEVGNVCFRGNYLDEVPPEPRAKPPLDSIPAPEKPFSMKSLVKDMVLEKFSGKGQNAEEWLKQFTKECDRMAVPQNRYIEALRLFLEGGAADWFIISTKLIGMNEEWPSWSTSFVQNFGPKCWQEVRAAYNFKYLRGSLTDYALKKIRLLLEVEPNITIQSRINLVVMGLPDTLMDKLDRSYIENHSDLMSELSRFECAPEKSDVMKSVLTKATSSPNGNQNPLFRTSGRKPCPLCEKAGFTRLHSVATCWNNPDNPDNKLAEFAARKSSSSSRPRNVKVVNNVELQDVINEVIPNPKN